MIVIALGSNLASVAGSPAQTIAAALEILAKRGVRIAAVSQLYRTPAWPDPADPPFVNATIRVETNLTPAELLAVLHDIETAFGRERHAKNAPRTLDLDLIDYDGRIEEGPPMLPHPRLAERGFVLVPLADIAPDWHHPVTERAIADLIASLPDESRNAVVRLAST